MEKQEYPKWIYSISGESRIVRNADEHKASGEGWFESPVDAAAAAEKKSAKK